MALLGIDIGTTGCKATLLSYEGKLLSQAYAEYQFITPKPGWAELEPEHIWQSVQSVIKKCSDAYPSQKAEAVSVSSFGETVVPVGRNGKACGNSIMYIDCRGREEADFLSAEIGPYRIYEITGCCPHPMYSINKILWLKRNDPGVFSKVWKFFHYADYVLFMLGAQPHMDYSCAGRTMAFDVEAKKWSADMLGAAGLDASIFGEPVSSASKVGTIKPELARALGLADNAVLASGGHDQVCAALGAGVVKSEIAAYGMGTVDCITPVFDKSFISKKTAGFNFVCVPYAVNGQYATYAFNFTGGNLLKWFRNNFGAQELAEAEKTGRDVYEIMIKKANKNPTDVLILPHFAGTGTPYMDSAAKGAIIGLDQYTSRADVLKAILEGVTYEMMLNLECLDKADMPVRELRAAGGGAKSDYWLQLKADMTGRRISSLTVSEGGTLGVAIMAGCAAGKYASPTDAASSIIKIKNTFAPDMKVHEVYQEKFERYKKIYSAVKEIRGT